MSDTEQASTKGVKLTNLNYNVWAIVLQSRLMTANAWRIVTGKLKQPAEVNAAALDGWLLKREEAAGIILNSLTPTQYVHIEGMMDDPVKMWNKL
jgi:hypothetical protein